MTTLEFSQEYDNLELFSCNNKDKGEASNEWDLTLADSAATAKTTIQSDLQELRKSSPCSRNRYKELIAGNNGDNKVMEQLKTPLSSCSNKKKKMDKRGVTFARKVSVRKIPPRSAMSKSIIADYWLFEDEFEIMKREYEYLLFFMDRGDSDNIDEETDSTRGLEYKTDEGRWKRYQHRQSAYDAVFNEQERQWREDNDNPFTIAQLYQESNKRCIDIALQKAKEDENAVQEYLSDMSTLNRAVKVQVHYDNKSLIGERHQRCSPPSKGTRILESSNGHTNDEPVACVGGNGYTGRRWKPAPKGQRKSLLDIWNSEDMLLRGRI